MEFLKKTEFTGCHRGMRYRLEGVSGGDGEKKLCCTVWPEPFSFGRTPQEKKQSAECQILNVILIIIPYFTILCKA